MQPAAEKLLQRYEDFLEYANLFAILIKNRLPLFLAECTVSFGADRSERSENKKDTNNF